MLWGISKDLGASGLRMGVLYSQNQALLKSAQGMNNFYQVSNQVQETVAGTKHEGLVIRQYVINTPSQPSQPSFLTHPINTSYQHILSIHLTNTHYQHML